jgi:hypothetical protein
MAALMAASPPGELMFSSFTDANATGSSSMDCDFRQAVQRLDTQLTVAPRLPEQLGNALAHIRRLSRPARVRQQLAS